MKYAIYYLAMPDAIISILREYGAVMNDDGNAWLIEKVQWEFLQARLTGQMPMFLGQDSNEVQKWLNILAESMREIKEDS